MPPQPPSATTPPRPRAKMTIRVYTVNRHGIVTQDRGTVTALPHDYEPAAEPCTPACAHEDVLR